MLEVVPLFGHHSGITFWKIVIKRIISAFIILIGLSAPAWAGFDEGLAAAKRGDYATALRGDGQALTPGMFDSWFFGAEAQLVTSGPGRYLVFFEALGFAQVGGELYEIDLRAFIEQGAL